jgi:hypothetical protein
LPEGASIEQQMMLSASGGGVAVCWRLIGQSDTPMTLQVSPIFTAAKGFAPTVFQSEGETNGDRLTWRPFRFSSKIIADTNGRLTRIMNPAFPRATPAAFEFDLGCRPAVLILRVELATEVPVNPLIRGFLAGLTEEREHLNRQGLNRLAA